MTDVIIGGKKYNNNYDHMNAADKKRVDELFKKYPLKPFDPINVSIGAEDIAKSISGDDSKRVLTLMVVAWSAEGVTPQMVVEHFKKEIDIHVWEMGYEVDYEFPGCIRAFKSKKKVFTWSIYIVSKKNKFSHRDVYFGEKGMDMKSMGKAMAERQQIKRQDFTKVK